MFLVDTHRRKDKTSLRVTDDQMDSSTAATIHTYRHKAVDRLQPAIKP